MSNSYTDIFTGSPVQPSIISETSYTLTESITLVWPQTGLETDNIVAGIIEISTDNPAFTITMPDATQVSNGQTIIFRNVGGENISILKSGGAALATVAASPDPNVIIIYLSNNSTAAGTWGVINLGTGTSSADAATLAGYGLKAITTTLNTNMDIAEEENDFTVDNTYRGKLITWNGGNGTITLPAANDASIGAGFIFSFNNATDVGGEVTFVPDGTDTIDGFTSLPVSVLESLSLISDGVNKWHSLGFGKETIFSVNILNKNLTGIVDNITLTDIEASKLIINFTGTLGANLTVFFPQTANQYYIVNGVDPTANTLTIQTTGGSEAYTIPEGQKYIYYCDGTDLFPIPTTVAPGGLTLPNGTAANPSLNFDGDADTGPYLVALGEYGISAGGVNRLTISAAGVKIATAGTAGAPSLSWTDPMSGIYFNAGVNISYLGAQVALFDNTGIITPSGTVTAPAYGYIGDEDTGIYRVAANTVGVASNGVKVGQFLNSGGVNQFSVAGTATNPSTLSLFNTNNTFSITLSVSGALAANATYTLPSVVPTVNGQPLVSTTAGITSWATSSFTADSITIPNGAASITHQTPAAPAANYTYVWPVDAPIVGDALRVANVAGTTITLEWAP